MFQNQRYLTAGISRDIPLEIQLFIWQCIDTMKVEPEPDYLQVFCLSGKGGHQVIVHTQECPDYRKAYEFRRENPITAKIYVIDDGDHSTMLFADEY